MSNIMKEMLKDKLNNLFKKYSKVKHKEKGRGGVHTSSLIIPDGSWCPREEIINYFKDGDDYKVEVTNLDTGDSITGLAKEEDDFKIGFDIDLGFVAAGQANADFNITAKGEGTAEVDLGYSIGNGENANALSDIFNQDGKNVKSDFRKIITSIGAESSRAQKMVNNQEVVLKQLNTLDRSISGVSLDEEMANLIKYQQSYSAAAKYINKTEELLDSLMTIV